MELEELDAVVGDGPLFGAGLPLAGAGRPVVAFVGPRG
jgi:hypothetical protein